MASGDTICVAIGEGSTYCIPSRGPLAAMPTPRPKEMNQLMDQSVDQSVTVSVITWRYSQLSL